MLGRLLCLFLGHKKMPEHDNKVAPLTIWWNDREGYPMWGCKRCRTMYIDTERASTFRNEPTYIGIEQAATVISESR